jgi:hypothetical protein
MLGLPQLKVQDRKCLDRLLSENIMSDDSRSTNPIRGGSGQILIIEKI